VQPKTRSLSEYISSLEDSYASVMPENVEEIIMVLHRLRNRRAHLFICGNGGSASTAEHFAVDVGVGLDRIGAGLKTYSLTSNSSNLTAIGNDLEFNQVFASQIKLAGEENDVLVVFSASGNSENVLNAIKQAKSQKMITIGFVGFNGGELIKMVDYALHIKTQTGEYGIVEDIHLSLCHYITERLRTGFNDSK
jgi:D-sedoheptulose 7-phosphate isomerase